MNATISPTGQPTRKTVRSRSANSITSSEIVALARHATLDVADPAPGVQPRPEGSEDGQVRVYTSILQRDEEQAAAAGQSLTRFGGSTGTESPYPLGPYACGIVGPTALAVP